MGADGESSPYAGWRWVDYLVVGLFAALTVGIGKYFSSRNTSTESYYVGSRSLPAWAVGFSILATLMSSITFLAYPATTITGDYRLYPKDFMLPVANGIAALLIAPRFRAKADRVSAYEVLEERFNLGLRLYGAFTYVVGQLLKLGTVLYLVSIPLGIVIGASSVIVHNLVIIGSGTFVALYSCAGGISAVVYTDVVQGVVLLFGGLAVVVVAMCSVPGGLPAIIGMGQEESKFSMGEMRFDWTSRTVPTVLVYGFTSLIGQNLSYQHTVQRYLLVSDDRELRRAIGLSTALSVPTWGLFYFVGTCVWAYYRVHRNAAVDQLMQEGQADDVFPHFIFEVLPPGVAGLVTAGVFAAAMSTMDSSLNAVSSVVVTDVFKRCLAPDLKDRQYLRIGRGISIGAAAMMVGMALVLGSLQKESMNDMYNGMQSILGGPVIGLFTCALFIPRVDSRTALLGVAGSLAVNFYLVGAHYRWLPADPWAMLLHTYWVSFWVNIAFFVTAALVELARALWRHYGSRRAYRYFKADDTVADDERLPGTSTFRGSLSGVTEHAELELAEVSSHGSDASRP